MLTDGPYYSIVYRDLKPDNIGFDVRGTYSSGRHDAPTSKG
jgi:hypothetical protein